MIRPNYRDFRMSQFLIGTDQHLKHSAKGSTWEEHKYIKRINGTYYYPDSYEGGRHLPDGEKEDKTNDRNEPQEIGSLSAEDIEALAKEVIRGNFGNGEVRKELLGEFYADIQKRVNEILKGSAGSKSVSEATTESVKAAEEAAKNASTSSTSSNSKVHSGVDMDKVLSVYKKK